MPQLPPTPVFIDSAGWSVQFVSLGAWNWGLSATRSVWGTTGSQVTEMALGRKCQRSLEKKDEAAFCWQFLMGPGGVHYTGGQEVVGTRRELCDQICLQSSGRKPGRLRSVTSKSQFKRALWVCLRYSRQNMSVCSLEVSLPPVEH